jgi:hypothetical protein
MPDDVCIPVGAVDEIERETQRQMRHFLPKLTLALGREPTEHEANMMHATLFRHFSEAHEVAPPDAFIQ